MRSRKTAGRDFMWRRLPLSKEAQSFVNMQERFPDIGTPS